MFAIAELGFIFFVIENNFKSRIECECMLDCGILMDMIIKGKIPERLNN